MAQWAIENGPITDPLLLTAATMTMPISQLGGGQSPPWPLYTHLNRATSGPEGYAMRLSPRSLVSLDVPTKGPGWSEFTQFLTYHLFCDEHWDVLSTIVDGYCVANHDWHDH